MRTSLKRSLAVTLCALAMPTLWLACGGGDETDPGLDASVAPRDASQQGGSDATTQAGLDAAGQAGLDAAGQAGLDAAAQAGQDASTPVGPDAGGGDDGYGKIDTIDFTTPYLLDFAQLNDQAYQQAHQNGFIQGAAFTGTYTSTGKAIPPAGSSTIALGAHGAGQNPFVGVIQQSVSGQTVVNPIVQMQFYSDTITPGANPIGLTESDKAMLFIMDSQGSSSCIAAIGVGSINVGAAGNTTAEGGSISFTGSNVLLYHPTNTPYGDISAQITAQGETVCPKQ
ncbi:MAG: hypothetical protein HY901_05245 [Deltaproteobacteria bacterium]|nr:hypothetical protein [Deltaproteobacteria bacterium]